MLKRNIDLENVQEDILGSEKRMKMDCKVASIPTVSATMGALARDSYTIAWICAITTEYVAAQAFLDERHEGLEYVPPNDNNDYALGKIGKHNIVIAVLPEGEYGTTSAASVATDMLRSFPNVKICLMVGIGGGAPSRKYDIRLGDIVVSTPCDGKGGVFHYDFGKTIQGEAFHTTGFLNQPPTVLRTAVAGLKAQYEIEGHQLCQAIDSTLGKKPRLQKKYSRPDPSSDRLYRSRFVHPLNNDSNCVTACGTDTSQLIMRSKRTQDEDNPAIYYGVIASGNQLMKDALVRDKLAAEEGILCFEMEAAGLMNHFPCLVIRGICDYSDSHKNKEWQGYAAMAAAAYAKSLLCRIVPNRVEAEKKILDLLPGMLNTISRTDATVSRTEVNVERMKSILNRKEDLEILDWLTPINYGPQQTDYFGRRQEGTGEWLLDSATFKEWVETKKKTLFCPGIPGAGKTILTSIAVDNLMTKFENDSSTRIAYIYCNFQRRSQQKIDDLLASLLKQLAEAYSPLPEPLEGLYHRHKAKRTRPSLEHISATLHSVTAKYSRVFIIVDALDECQSENCCRIRLLSELFNLQKCHGINIFATSRYIPEIVDQFKGSSESLEIRASRQDVERYLENHMSQLRPFVQQNRELQKDIKIGITEAADGMFLLVQIYIGLLDDKMTPNDVRSALRVFRKQDLEAGEDHKAQILAEAYRQTMDRINGQKKGQKELATKVLTWITCAKRQLTKLELQHALATKVGKAELDQEDMPCINDIVSVCAGLVVVDEESGIIRLVHYTTQEYFERMQKHWFPDAETDITKSCIAYLSFSVFESGFCQTDDEFEKRLRSNQLYDYVARNWGYHAREASAVVEQLILSFLKSQTKISASSQAMLASRSYNGYSQRVPKYITAPHFTAYFGLKKALIALLNDGYYPDLKDSYGCTPLLWATREGHESIVDLLLATPDVDADSTDNDGRTPLSWAAERGYKSAVKLLLDKKGVDPNSKDAEGGQTPLSWAAENGCEEVVKLLLDTNCIDPDSKDLTYGQTPLLWAVEKGHQAIVELLLASEKVNPNAKNHASQTPLWYALENGHEAVAKLLLADSRIEPNVKNEDGQIPLWYTLENGHEAVVKLLLALEKVNPNARNKAGQTPLLWAMERGHEVITRLLLEHGADVEAKDQRGQTPLLLAATSGHEVITRLLLEQGADVTVKDPVYSRTPLLLAAVNGHEAVVRLLLEQGADVDGRMLLSLAAARGYEVVVRILLEQGANVEAEDRHGQTPLSLASASGREAAVKLLLKHGSDIKVKDWDSQTPLLLAAARGHEVIVRLLLEYNADIEVKGWDNRTPLLLAIASGKEAVVRLLLEYGADIKAIDQHGQTPLLLAIASGEEAVVRLLLEYGADIIVKSPYYSRTPLLLAATSRHEVIFRLLLKHGANIKVKAQGGWTPLLLAVANGDEAAVKLLLEHSADIKAKDWDSQTLLLLAAARGHEVITRLLLEHGADIEAKDWDSQTPLLLAAARGHEVIVRLLLEQGADVEVKDWRGQTPLLLAAMSGHEDITRLLLEHGANIKAKNWNSWTPLLSAAASGREVIVRLLLEQGADIEVKDWRGQTPLLLAATSGHEDITRLLLEHGANIKAKDWNGRTPLLLAAARDYKVIIRLLLEQGADVEADD